MMNSNQNISFSLKDLMKIYKQNIKNTSWFIDVPMKMEMFSKITVKPRKMMKENSFRYFIIHLALILTRNVNGDGEFTFTPYNASGRQFLLNFIQCASPENSGMDILRAIEMGIAQFNYSNLKFPNQNPLKHSLGCNHINPDNENSLNVVSFILETSDKSENFVNFG